MVATYWGLLVRRIFRRFPAGWLVGVLSLGRLTVVKLVEEQDCEPSSSLVEDQSPLIRAWWEGNALRNLAIGALSELSFRRFSHVNISANRRGGFLQDGDRLIVPRTGLAPPARVFFPNTDIAGILDQAGSSVLLDRPEPAMVFQRGIFAGSMAPHNWFHWVIDNLPNLYMARFLPTTFGEYPLLVPEVALERPSWKEPLDLITNGRELVGVPGDRWVHVDSLIRLDGVTRPNPRSLAGPFPARIGVLLTPFLGYRDHLLESLGLTSCRLIPGRRIFLARKADEVRRYNQEEILGAAKKYGFESVYLDELGFHESVKLFREAEVIIGPHGAAWANLIFAHTSARAMLWTWPNEAEDNWYQNVAYCSGVDYLQIFTKPQPARPGERVDPRVADYELDLNYFRHSVEELLARSR